MAMNLVVPSRLIISRADERLLASQEIAALHGISTEIRAVNDKATSAALFPHKLHVNILCRQA
jgi:hypothetical protein